MCGCNKARNEHNAARAAAAVAAAAAAAAAAALPTVDTSIWGPPLWKALHVAAEFSDGPQWNGILSAMITGLPCPDCSAHYSVWYKQQFPPPPPPRSMYRRIPFNRRRQPPAPTPVILPIPIQTRILALHNEVNTRLGKPVWTVADVSAQYGGDKQTQKDAAIAALQTLNGVIGTQLYDQLLAVLQSL